MCPLPLTSLSFNARRHRFGSESLFEDEAFIGYLKYLQYWQRPEYVKFIMYPHCLYFLELLQNANFRNAMAHPGNKELAHRQHFLFLEETIETTGLKHILPRPLPEPSHCTPLDPISTSRSTCTILCLLQLLACPLLLVQIPSPMPYGMPILVSSAFGKIDIRISGI
ncbi:hypothetical protein NC653_030037 [Populus alba x Populus x berolinensis]|uniref:Mediator of RNA polymerase II transcription subunit 31 n=1 Tax=Populus alba x Populus x berolinensis TaxID=444605 RepID=A0AAD6Q583_9ROSI|nr:hypothetical protein NC653_030037 [Populus alba x Populus x berolinensis]